MDAVFDFTILEDQALFSKSSDFLSVCPPIMKPKAYPI